MFEQVKEWHYPIFTMSSMPNSDTCSNNFAICFWEYPHKKYQSKLDPSASEQESKHNQGKATQKFKQMFTETSFQKYFFSSNIYS